MIGTPDRRSYSDGNGAQQPSLEACHDAAVGGRAKQSVASAMPPTVAAPPRPSTLAETGLTLANLADLALKLVYLHGSLTGGEICAQLRLPFSVLEEALTFLRQAKCLDVRSGDLLGQISYRFHLTEEGRTRAP